MREDDRLIDVKVTDGKQDVILSTKYGLSIRFSEKEIRPSGRTSMGVIGIRFKKENDEVVGGEIFNPEDEEKSIFTACKKGYGKRTMISHYRKQHRGGKGIIDIKVTDKNGEVVGIKSLRPKDEIILPTKNGMVIRIKASDIRVVGRNTLGVKLINLAPDDEITDIALVVKEDEKI